MRRAFSETLLKLAREDEKIIFLTGDLGFQVFDEYCKEFPKRYINAGVAEAQMVDCAAGLALEGWKPLVYSIASFMTGRAFEQIRLSLSYQNLPVVVVGAGGGYTYASSGVTHHAKEDLALMSLLPNMTVVCPGDPQEVSQLLPQMIAGDGPSYIRIGRFGEPTVLSDAPIRIGQGRIVREGSAVAFMTTGSSVVQACEAKEALKAHGIDPLVCHFHTVKPLDQALLDKIAQMADLFIIVEDHGLQGGLRNAILRWAHLTRASVRIVDVGPGDEIILGNLKQSEIMLRYGMTAAALVSTCLDEQREKGTF